MQRPCCAGVGGSGSRACTPEIGSDAVQTAKTDVDRETAASARRAGVLYRPTIDGYRPLSHAREYIYTSDRTRAGRRSEAAVIDATAPSAGGRFNLHLSSAAAAVAPAQRSQRSGIAFSRAGSVYV